MKTCDNASVGVIIQNADGDYLMFNRATFPPGVAPAAGHVDEHGTVEDAARAEVHEELGLTVESLRPIADGWRDNRCRRNPGPRGVGHQWTVFHATVTGDLNPSTRETANVRWIPAADLQALADRTSAYARGGLTNEEFAAAPGIEPVWITWLYEVGVIHLEIGELTRIDRLAAAGGNPKES
ncbi:NUDIX hydrolase [Streptomyces sp. H10-C2]|uniref:NUDIX hydrolase n=1 Tax=unclassified Streptomyces TaxID=2593676 RepID=UPI0024B913B8|nr:MULTISPECIES: NUDIX hydrolase [unclassified Streptomyces]MDJ0342220.1 NUDIX hydrolase [Streptomyces sp. PH10-H1]MDJ0368734.1 NUDIX hydrolase [Streptomyces sp. H10-C2]